MTIAQLYTQMIDNQMDKYNNTKAERIINISKNTNGTYEVQSEYGWYTAIGTEYVVKVQM
jgi:hypothetical protein